jgi:iron complex transport system ATP-binding protein
MRDATKGNKTVIGVFHDINLASTYCDHLIVFNEGKIHAAGSPSEILTEGLLREIFKIEPVIKDNPINGTPYIYISDGKGGSFSAAQKVHIISGGGSGSTLASVLYSTGFEVSCGVLSENDSDYQFAKNHGIFVISELPFSPISPDSIDTLSKHLQTMDWVVVTELPVGWGNYSNIQILKRIPPEKIILMISGKEPIISDFTGGEATKILSELIESGSYLTRNPNEVLEYLKTEC